jgi:uncharacterized membrane protein (DUF2068 family)
MFDGETALPGNRPSILDAGILAGRDVWGSIMVNRPLFVKILLFFFLVAATYSIGDALCFALLQVSLIGALSEPELLGQSHGLASLGSFSAVMYGVYEGTTAWGLWKMRNWGRICGALYFVRGMIAGAVGLAILSHSSLDRSWAIKSSVELVLSLLVFIFLLSRRARQAFEVSPWTI